MQRARRCSCSIALGLGDHVHKRPDQLSGGQRQRVAVARALANEPPVILADEPTGSLNSKASGQVFDVLHELVEEHGKTVVAVTHDMGLAERMHRHVELLDGRIVADEIHARSREPRRATHGRYASDSAFRYFHSLWILRSAKTSINRAWRNTLRAKNA